jgi:hypothetical protein
MARNNQVWLSVVAGVVVWLWSPYGTPTRHRLLASINR